MFADPFSNLMLIVLLFFAGLLIMFIFMLRSIEANWRSQEETRRQIALSLSDLERKINELGRLYSVSRAGDSANEKKTDGITDSDLALPGLSLEPEAARTAMILDDEEDSLPNLLFGPGQPDHDGKADAPAQAGQADSEPAPEINDSALKN